MFLSEVAKVRIVMAGEYVDEALRQAGHGGL